MPVSPTPPEDYWAFIAEAYARAEVEILELIRSYVARGIDLQGDAQWAVDRLAEVQSLTQKALVILARVNAAQAQEILLNLQDAYRAGEETALRDLGRGTEEPRSAVSAPARVSAVQAVSGALVGQMAQQMSNLVRTIQDTYAEVVNRTVATVAAGGRDRRTAAQSALNQLLGRGLKMGPPNSNGARLSLPDYVSMSVRTGVANASIQGHLDSLGMLGADLVYIHPGPRHCELCDAWANKPLWRGSGSKGYHTFQDVQTGKEVSVYVYGTLDEAKAAGWGHPNCRCNVGAYLPGASRLPSPRPKWDQAGYEAQQAQRGLERGIRTYKTRAALALSPEDRAKAGAQVRVRQAALRQHLSRHPYLKRQSRREQAGRTI